MLPWCMTCKLWIAMRRCWIRWKRLVLTRTEIEGSLIRPLPEPRGRRRELGERLVNWTTNAKRMRPAAMAGAVLFLCLLGVAAPGQRVAGRRWAGGQFRFAQAQVRQNQQQNPRQYRNQQRQNQQRPNQPAMRPYQNQPRPYQQAPQYQNQPRPYQQAPQYNGAQRQPQPAFGGRPDLPSTTYNRPAYPYQNRPGVYPGAAPPGHLGDWLNRHQGLPVQDQERLLRSDPNFNRLPPETQQRLVQQLHQLDTLPEAQRERRRARSEMLERMSPQEQMQVRQAGRSYLALPRDRQAMVKRAFQDLRSVPLDQRATVLNSARYQNQFSAQERDMLNNLLRAEPYEPPR